MKINPCEHQTVTNTLAHFTLHLLSFNSHIIPLQMLLYANPYTRTSTRTFNQDGREKFWGKIKIKRKSKHDSYWFRVLFSFRLFSWCWNQISISNFLFFFFRSKESRNSRHMNLFNLFSTINSINNNFFTHYLSFCVQHFFFWIPRETYS